MIGLTVHTRKVIAQRQITSTKLNNYYVEMWWLIAHEGRFEVAHHILDVQVGAPLMMNYYYFQ